MQKERWQQIHEKHSGTRQVVLSLEMFETNTQTVLDEYLKGLIRETDFVGVCACVFFCSSFETRSLQEAHGRS